MGNLRKRKSEGGKGANPLHASTKGREREECSNVRQENSVSWADCRIGVVIFIISLVIYTEAGSPMLDVSGDVEASIWLPIAILKQNAFTFDHENFPFFFNFAQYHNNGTRLGRIPGFRKYNEYVIQLDAHKDSFPVTAGDALDNGIIKVDAAGPAKNYNVLPSNQGGLVCTFGIGTGLIFSGTVLAAVSTGLYDINELADPDNFEQLATLAHFTASALVAASGAFVYLTVRHIGLFRFESICIVVLYCFGSCVWSISARALWQHGPVNFFFALGLFLYVWLSKCKSNSGKSVLGACIGATVGLAVLCRPSAVFAPLCIGIALLLRLDFVALVAFVAGGAPLAMALAQYNIYHFGSMIVSGQTIVSRDVAIAKTGSPDLWSTPLLGGASTLLFSPSRGLFIYSPWCALPIIFAILETVGMQKILNSAAQRDLLLKVLGPWAGAAFLQVIFSCKWFDYYGGWCYGYRPIVDILPILACLTSCVIFAARRQKALWVVLLFLGSWSVAVQGIGALSYNIIDWNGQMAVTWHEPDGAVVEYLPCNIDGDSIVTNPSQKDIQAAFAKWPQSKGYTSEFICQRKNIDDSAYRWRLWDWKHNQIFYFWEHFWSARKRTQVKIRDTMLSMKPGERLTHILAGKWIPPEEARSEALRKHSLKRSNRVLG